MPCLNISLVKPPRIYKPSRFERRIKRYAEELESIEICGNVEEKLRELLVSYAKGEQLAITANDASELAKQLAAIKTVASYYGITVNPRYKSLARDYFTKQLVLPVSVKINDIEKVKPLLSEEEFQKLLARLEKARERAEKLRRAREAAEATENQEQAGEAQQ